MIVIPELDERFTEIWRSLLELTAEYPEGWTLIGAQMVFLHAWERGADPPRFSTDLDLVVDIRQEPRGLHNMIETLERLGYEFEGANSSGIGHRFARDIVTIDILAPDGVGPRADVRTRAGARTVKVPGSTQALRRSAPVEIMVDDIEGTVPRPDLLGAILVKARAVSVDDLPEDQRLDLAFLLTLVDDPSTLASELRGNERNWLRTRTELLDRDNPAWLALPSAEDGRLALRILADS